MAELRRYGHDAEYRRPSLAAARAYCRQLAQGHYENFLVSSLLVPRGLRPHFHAIYAWCRWADDLGDETAGGDEALRLLQWWRDATLALFSAAGQESKRGGPAHPVLVALRETIHRFSLPPEPFLQLLTAFAQDQRVQRYATREELLDYCRNSANPVGRLVLYLCREFTPEKAAWADAICTGLQLANFWQDVARDADLGRRYLPTADLTRFGYSEEDWAARRCTPTFRQLMQAEVEWAATCFEAGKPLLRHASPRLRGQLRLFIGGGEAILEAIRRQRYDVWERRPVVHKRTQLRLLTQALLADQWLRPASRVPPTATSLAQSQRLCEALARRQAKNFYFAFLLLPLPQRQAMSALYAFMRVADDLADADGELAQKRENLRQWREKLSAALDGQPDHPLLPALAEAVQRHRLEPAWLFELLDGVESDLEADRRFADDAALDAYCHQVAGTVGLCCVRVWGCHDPAATPLAEAAGRAFQITNILRDLSEDLAAGRLYLPLSTLRAVGLTEEELRRDPSQPAVRQACRLLGARAAAEYGTAQGLANFLPPPGRAVWQVMSSTYRGLLEQLAARDFDCRLPRARLTQRQKAARLLAGLWSRMRNPAVPAGMALPTASNG